MRPTNVSFSIVDKTTGMLRANIKSAHLEKRLLSSAPLTYLIENGVLFEVFYERVTKIQYNSDWTWMALISYQTHKDRYGRIQYYAVVRPYFESRPSNFN